MQRIFKLTRSIEAIARLARLRVSLTMHSNFQVVEKRFEQAMRLPRQLVIAKTRSSPIARDDFNHE